MKQQNQSLVFTEQISPWNHQQLFSNSLKISSLSLPTPINGLNSKKLPSSKLIASQQLRISQSVPRVYRIFEDKQRYELEMQRSISKKQISKQKINSFKEIYIQNMSVKMNSPLRLYPSLAPYKYYKKQQEKTSSPEIRRQRSTPFFKSRMQEFIRFHESQKPHIAQLQQNVNRSPLFNIKIKEIQRKVKLNNIKFIYSDQMSKLQQIQVSPRKNQTKNKRLHPLDEMLTKMD